MEYSLQLLVADDDPVYRMLLGRRLAEWGYEVELAADGEDALAALERKDGPCLAILDWGMPGTDGLEICRRVRANSKGRYKNLLLVTARDAPADLVAGLDAGADDFLTKPVNMPELRLRLRAGSRILEFAELLERQAAELARSNADLEQFAYVASHDLQEPLRMVAGFVQLLARRYAGRLDAEADEFIGFAVDGARRMQQLISDLLTLSRVGTRGKEFQAVELESVVSEILLNLGPAIEQSGAAVTHDRLPAVVGDRGQLVQLLQNLTGNAIKFRRAEPPRGHISAAESDREWTVSVRDNGIGIAPQHSDRVFQIFQRLHTREEYPGTGIGLAICRKIVQRHKGSIWFDSVPGSGTTFRFTLPKRNNSGPASAHAACQRNREAAIDGCHQLR